MWPLKERRLCNDLFWGMPPWQGIQSILAVTLIRRYATLIFGTTIVVAVAIALWLRWSALGSQSLWADEGFTILISQFSPRDICRILRTDTGPPLYYILIHYWRGWFGISETSLRAFSALFATLSLPLFYLVARKFLFSRLSLALAMMLYSVSFLQIWYAKEARCYALLVFLSLAAVYLALLCLQKSSAIRLLGLGLAVAASLYTHNMAFFYLPGLVVLWFVYPSEMTIRVRIRRAVVVAILIFVLYVPWLPTLIVQQRLVKHSFWVTKPTLKDLLATLAILGGFDSATFQHVFRSIFHSEKLFGFWTWTPLFFIIFVLCVLGSLYSVTSTNRRKGMALLAYSVLPVLLVFFESRFFTPLYINRVFTGACVLLPLVFCAPIAFQSGKRQELFGLIALLVLAGAAISAFGYLRRERKEDWRGATEYLLRGPERQRLVVVAGNSPGTLVRYYSAGADAPLEIARLAANFNLTDVSFGSTNVPTISQLVQDMDSGRYKEIDFAFSDSAKEAKDLTPYLKTHCASVDVAEFHWIKVWRCLAEPR